MFKKFITFKNIIYVSIFLALVVLMPMVNAESLPDIKNNETNNIRVIPPASINDSQVLSQSSQLINEATKKDSIKPNLLSLVSSLAMTIILIFIALWTFVKFNKYLPKAVLKGDFKDLDNISILSTANLGQGKSVHLIKVNGQKLVIGSSSSNINLLAEISDKEVEVIQKQYEERPKNLKQTDKTKKESSDEVFDLYKDYLKN